MKNVLGVIYTGEKDSFLRELTFQRAIAAVPVVSRYRVIDFFISAMVNSGLHNVGVIMQKNYNSLMDHLGSGKEWDLHGKNEGLRLLPPFLTRENVGVYSGSLDALQSNKNFLMRSRQEYVLFCNTIILYNAQFNGMFDEYMQSGADVMMLYTRKPEMKRNDYGTYLNVDDNNRVIDIEVDPAVPHYDCVSMDAFIIKKELLIRLVDYGASHDLHDITRDIFMKMSRESGLKIMAHEYFDPCFRLDSIQSYFRFNMDILDSSLLHQLFPAERPVYTKIRDEMPARYMDKAKIINSMIADGCIINGVVDHSLLSRGVVIEEGAIVKNSIIMQDCRIESGVQLENCILDKQAKVQRDGRLIGPASYPIVISKNMVI